MSKKPRNVGSLRVAAGRVAIRLLGDLKAGRFQKIGIDEVISAVQKDPGYPKDKPSRDEFVSLTLRRLVEKVG